MTATIQKQDAQEQIGEGKLDSKAIKAIEDFNDLHKDEIKELQDLETGKTPEYKGSKKRIKTT